MRLGDQDEEAITVNVPTELPILTRRASRILLAMLIEATEVEILEGSSGRGIDDC